MGDKTTSKQILNLMANFNLSGKNILELGYFPGSTNIDLKEHFQKRNANHFRSNLPGNDGIDFQWDLHEPFPPNKTINKFDYVICSSVMEHVAKPWLAAKNIEDILQDGGLLIWTTPWVWRIHGYPNDYWRFSPNGVKQLFSYITWLWTGYHIRLGNDQSVLIDTAGWEKDPVLSFGRDSFKKLIGTSFTTGRMNIRKKKMFFIEKEKVFGYESPENSDDFLYGLMTNGNYDPPLFPMGEFIMIGKKQKT